MRQYIYSLMIDKRDGFIASIIKGLLSIVSFFYGLAVKAVRSVNIFAARKLPCKVVSIGNLTLGGTGKTPTACMLAKVLERKGRKPAVLIRGYGNDEWRMVKGLLDNIPVIVGRDRLSSGRKACYQLKRDTVILDDGFQHWRLKRDLDMVLIDSTNPFGNRKLFPRGILREGIKDLKRADIIMLTKTDMGREKVREVRDELKSIAPHTSILESVHNPLWFYNLTGREALELLFVKHKKVCVLSSIVNTEYFEHTLASLGAEIIARFHYPDHYDYKDGDLKFVIDKCERLNIDTIVTTEKDAAKLGKSQITNYKLQILVLHIELKVTDGLEELKKRLHSLYRS